MPIDQPSKGDEENPISDDSERLREEDALRELRSQTRAYMMSLGEPVVDDGDSVSETVYNEISQFVRGELPAEQKRELWQKIKHIRSYRACWKSVIGEDELNDELFDDE